MKTNIEEYDALKKLAVMKDISLSQKFFLTERHSSQLLMNPLLQKQAAERIASRLQLNQQHSIQHLQDIIKKVKVNTLVSQFIYRLQRNIVSKQPVQYQVIQNSLEYKKSLQKYCRSVDFNDRLIAVFMGINILAILLIQTLSAFQGFYLRYQQQDSGKLTIFILEIVCLVIFFMKIVYCFLSSKGVFGMKQKYLRYVIKHYVFSLLFLFDMLNFIMTLFKLLLPRSSLVGILGFVVTALSLPVLQRNFQFIQSVFFNNYKRRQYYSLLKILLFNIFFAQFTSSIFMALSYYDLNDNWITKAINNGNMAPNLDWWQIYFYAMYWAITTLTTIGYGDITPGNYFQVAFVSLLMLTGTAVLSYNLSQIGNVISNLRSIDKRRKQQTIIFKMMAKDENISYKLSNKILDFIQKSAEVQAQFQFEKRKQFIQHLPEQLKQQFQAQYSKNLFEKVPFFSLLQPQTLAKLTMKIDGQIYYPGQTITKKNGRLQYVMFLKHGKVGLAYEKVGSILNGLILQTRDIKRHNDNPYLLNKYLLSRQGQLNYQIISQSYSILLVLKYEDLRQVLYESKKDNQFFFHLYNKISFIEQQWDKFQCRYCAPRRHTVFHCPKLHYIPYKSLIVQKYINGPNIQQKRRIKYKRKYNQLRNKSPYIYWNLFYRHLQIQWHAGYSKSMRQLRQRQQKELQEQIKQKYSEENKFALKISGQVLKMHCCQLNQRYILNKHMQMDQMCNFDNFFPQFNPENIKMLNLKGSPKIRMQIRSNY